MLGPMPQLRLTAARAMRTSRMELASLHRRNLRGGFMGWVYFHNTSPRTGWFERILPDESRDDDGFNSEKKTCNIPSENYVASGNTEARFILNSNRTRLFHRVIDGNTADDKPC